MESKDISHKQIDFIIAGQPKSGTTALAQFLSEHPEVCMSQPKEPGYFATDLMQESDEFHGKQKHFKIRKPGDYDKCFAHCEPKQLLSEATTNYLYSTAAANNIYQHNPNAKIIIMLRNPVDFIHSLHTQYVNAVVEDEKDFEKALDLEVVRQDNKEIPSGARCPSLLFYTQRGMYYHQIKRYFDKFPAENILVITNEEFRDNNQATYKKILDFLQVDTDFAPSFKTVKGSETPRLKLINKLLRVPVIKNGLFTLLPNKWYVRLSHVSRMIILKKQQRNPIDPAFKKRLYTLFFEDISKTSRLLGRDLIKEWKMQSYESLSNK